MLNNVDIDLQFFMFDLVIMRKIVKTSCNDVSHCCGSRLWLVYIPVVVISNQGFMKSDAYCEQFCIFQ